MVPCLHQCNVYIKRKLRVCSEQKCNRYFGAKSLLRRTDLQGALFHAASYRADSTNLRNSGLAFAKLPCLHQCNFYIKRKLKECSPQKCKPCFGSKSPLRRTDLKRTRFHAAPYKADSTNLREFGARYRHGTVFAPMECLYQNEAEGMLCQKNVILVSVQKAHFPVRTCKEPCFMQRRIGPTVQIWGNSGRAIAMVPCLHQWNVYIKTELSGCCAQKCNPFSVQKAHIAVRTCKELGSMQRRIGPTVQICVNSGLAIAIVQCLHQWNVYIKRKLRVCSAQKCNPCLVSKSPLRSTDLQITRFLAAPYRADSTTLREFVTTYRHVTVFAPTQCLYQ